MGDQRDLARRAARFVGVACYDQLRRRNGG